MSELRIMSCAACPCGRASGVSMGGQCPLVDRRRRRGELLFVEGDPASHVWFIKRGTVVLTRAGNDGNGSETPRAVRRAGSFIGLEALVRPTYLDTARVMSAAVICGASREVVDDWLGARGTPARMALEQTLLTDAADVPRASNSDGNAVQRVARWIIQEAQAGVETAIPRRYTAGLLGMVPETFSRALARLEELGAIDVTRRTLTVVDEMSLRRAAEA